ncbi:PREDICTED: mitogen-activated protein kinase kinase kinase YODA-like [Nicotiana attenuata]|uniref:mitogen-activated protein kinase kinase kinase n=1 Tax=Nicotiana attenuata TaxID=49451 RepID=A0A1J6IW23_NICAT|nr:PREDICTED: mitogen-activated protein kinase kinase kinase YODA-like [Nicotiana attenuata]OIT02995.1 mitogen-activated protein kinase kinase kinase yoda [Nicotiana attenuata]
MHWWQSAFSSSSSRASSTRKVHSDDSFIVTRGSSRCIIKAALFGSRNGSRSRHNISRRKKHQQPAGNHNDVVDEWRSQCSYENSPGRGSSEVRPPPQPLPLPDLKVLLRQDPNLVHAPSVPLPSPREGILHHKAGEETEREKDRERERVDVFNGDAHNNGGTTPEGPLSLDGRTRTELSRKTQPQKLLVPERIAPDFWTSAPTSPYASPARSQLKSGDFIISPLFITPPGVFQVWSAPEMPPSDTPHGVGFYYNKAFSVDNSPLHSPRLSPQPRSKSPSGPASPLHHLPPNDQSSMARRETCAQGNVHPLPLPPLAIPPVSPPTPKTDITPVKCQWKKGKLIGRGTFGSVYVASNRETGALCAMKEVELLPDDPKSAESIRQLEQEIKVLSQLKHPNIVQYYGSEIVDDRFYIYLEYVHPGSINKFIQDHCGAITESIVRNFTRHILCGLAYLHSKKTIHRDIKGANLLVDAYGVVKLADFGMAKHLNGHSANLSLKGSPYWMAPELLQSVMQRDNSSDLALAIDIWSLGCTIIEMLNGKPPWSEYEAAAAMFKVLKDTPPIPETLSPEGKDFLHCCFRRNPAERPSASMLLEHRFVRLSHQPDVPSFVQQLNGIKLTEKLHSQREQISYKLESVHVSLER